MSGLALGMVLAAAVFHALWNLAAKSSQGDTTIFVWMYYSLGCVVTLPFGIGYAIYSGASYGWELPLATAVTAVMHIGYAMLLQTGYRKADLGVVYPVARGVGPVLTIFVAVCFLGERPETLALIGGLIIIGGILIVTGKKLFQRSSGLGTGLFYGSATGAAIATYTLWDNFSVNTLAVDPILYFGLSGVFQAVLMLPWVLRKRTQIAPTWRSDGRRAMIIAVLSPLAYILVLYAMTFTSVALVAPVRESSIIIGALLAWWLFKEEDPLRRILGACVVVGGIALIAIS
ncbi:EamA family transporter [Nesterenkonia sp. MY13]|uniref:EamA family transporter n=1 Tax=Nesterenkonia sedimenti TaxID=1463632 RepID=A0A7X8TJI2_9MICC|nr:DMT family transporter [Nesterenkonia sedimenti]NLS09950.1 EamA family transporter [Nesterenkonia sedimenti]